MHNKTIIGFGFRMIARIIKASVCVIRLSLRLRQITQTSALIILAIMLNLIQQLLNVSTLSSNIEKDSIAHQMKLIKMNTKLNFYSKFINNTNSSDCYDLVKNMRHRRILAKFRVGNHNLQIEKGRHTKPLTPRELRSCECCHSKKVEDECHFFFDCVSYADLRNNLFYDIRKYCKSFKNLSDEDLIAFFFNSVDPVICKKMSHFIYEASLRRDDLLIRNL